MNTFIKKIIFLFSTVFLLLDYGYSKNDIDKNAKSNNNSGSNNSRVFAECAKSTSKMNLDINNVRTMLHNGGDM